MITGFDLVDGGRYVRRDGSVTVITERRSVMVCDRGNIFDRRIKNGNLVSGIGWMDAMGDDLVARA